MKNGDYILVIAPDDFPGKKYRNRYCYEHHLIYWQTYGIVPADDEIIHHINGDKHDNSIENLRLEKRNIHSKHHGLLKGINYVDMICPICHKQFSRDRRQTHLDKPGQQCTYCSRHCAVIGQKHYGLLSTGVLREYKKI